MYISKQKNYLYIIKTCSKNNPNVLLNIFLNYYKKFEFININEDFLSFKKYVTCNESIVSEEIININNIHLMKEIDAENMKFEIHDSHDSHHISNEKYLSFEINCVKANKNIILLKIVLTYDNLEQLLYIINLNNTLIKNEYENYDYSFIINFSNNFIKKWHTKKDLIKMKNELFDSSKDKLPIYFKQSIFLEYLKPIYKIIINEQKMLLNTFLKTDIGKCIYANDPVKLISLINKDTNINEQFTHLKISYLMFAYSRFKGFSCENINNNKRIIEILEQLNISKDLKDENGYTYEDYHKYGHIIFGHSCCSKF